MSSKTILVVEDEAIIAMLLQKVLETMGYTVAGPVANGEDAIRIAASENPDLILMDIRIEGDIDGIETTLRIHENSDIPVIYLTAHSDPDTVERAMQTNPSGFLLKPFKRDELAKSIESTISEHANGNGRKN